MLKDHLKPEVGFAKKEVPDDLIPAGEEDFAA